MATDLGQWSRMVGTARSWRGDLPLRQRIRNIGHLLAGNFLSSLIALLAVALTARALGTSSYGILALTITYVRAVERLVSFQAWQPMIKYGAALNERGDRTDLKVLLKFGLALDAAGAVAAWLIAIIGAVIATSLFGWSQDTLHLVIIYCTVLLFNLNGMPTAVLRLGGRFRLTAYGQVASAVSRLALCGIGVAMGGGLFFFTLIWMGTQILGSLIFLITAFRELRRQGVSGLRRAPLKGVTKRFPGLWSFALSTNLSLTLRSSAQQLDTLLVGALADPASAGLYHIAKQIGRMAQQVGIQVQAVVYPDIARLWAAQAVVEFRRAVFQVEAMLATFGVLGVLFFAVAAEPLLRWTAGPEFVAAAPLLIVQMIAVLLTLGGSAAHSGLLAMGWQKKALTVVMISTLAFHVTAFALIPLIGAMGANVAHVVRGLIWLGGLWLIFRRAIRESPAAPAAPAAEPIELAEADG